MRRVPIFATIVVLAAAAVMVALGVWQLQRLEQKEALLARYAAAEGIALLGSSAPAVIALQDDNGWGLRLIQNFLNHIAQKYIEVINLISIPSNILLKMLRFAEVSI